jgi:DivIVA domain-containing protein
MGPDLSITPEAVQARGFATAFRGYDAGEVKAYLGKIANELKAWRERAEQLESAWHSAEERAARPPVLDEDTLMAAVGEETAAILRTARAAAADLRAKAAEETEKLLSDASAEAETSMADAQTKAERSVQQAESDAARILEEATTALATATAGAEQAANAILERARQEAAELLQKATEDADSIRHKAEKEHQLTIEGANATRDKILEDLSRRRRVATVQIEQLRAGRERLIESYAMVRRTLEDVQSELSRADAEARAAADDVGRRLRDQTDVELSEDTLAATDPVPVPPPDTESPAPRLEAQSPASPVEADSPASPVEAKSPDAAGAATGAGPAEMATEPHAPDAQAGHPVPAGTPGPDFDAPAPEVAGGAVEELFARIRGKGPEPQAADAERRPGKKKDKDKEKAVTAPRSAVTVIESEPEGANGVSPADDADDAGNRDAPAAVAADPSADSATASPAIPDGDESLLQSREFAIVDLEVTLTRRLKRVLQDEQNDVLDRLRSLKAAPTLETLLPDEPAQTERYAVAARPMLADAAAAGAVFADETLGLPGRDAPVEVDVADLATETGSGIVPALRRRLEQAIEAGAGEDDQAVVVESLGAAYREWKTQRIERLAGDMLSAAFSRGTWQATPDGARLRWVVEDADGPCPDCDDDALAGDLPKGELFPTGQRHPPAHSGCRCLLVPRRASG